MKTSDIEKIPFGTPVAIGHHTCLESDDFKKPKKGYVIGVGYRVTGGWTKEIRKTSSKRGVGVSMRQHHFSGEIVHSPKVVPAQKILMTWEDWEEKEREMEEEREERRKRRKELHDKKEKRRNEFAEVLRDLGFDNFDVDGTTHVHGFQLYGNRGQVKVDASRFRELLKLAKKGATLNKM